MKFVLSVDTPKQMVAIALNADGFTVRDMVEKLSDQKASIAQLRRWAEAYPNPKNLSTWVFEIFHQPPRRRPPKNRMQSNLQEHHIGYYELRNIALEWDKLGPATPVEFVEAVSCETTGHPRTEAVLSTLRTYSEDLERDTAQEESSKDDWTKWRYGE